MRKIGLDLGSKTCGISISDSTNKLASGICNFKYENNNLMLIIQKLKKIIDDYDNKVDSFILGYPTFTKSGQKTKNTILVEKFESLLKQHFTNIQVIRWCENYTTKNATDYLCNFEIKASTRKKIIDMVAANFILQSYLDSIPK